MIHSVKIKHFQSLYDISLELAPLTVIVGPSSSGKSAFMRGMRTLTSNRRGNEFISHGERTAVITAVTDRGTVTLTRSHSQQQNSYTVTPDDPQHPLAPERTFSKLGGDTPPEVSEFLGIEAKDPINYASQFDKPYLLDDSAGEAARTLGALTNVAVIFEAARESNRRKLSTAQTLRTRAEDLETIKAKIPRYRSLKQQAAALTAAEQQLTAARAAEKKILDLATAITAAETAARAISALEPAASVTLPSAEDIISAAAGLERLTAALRAQVAAVRAVEAAQTTLGAATIVLTEVEDEYRSMLGEITDTLAGWFAALEQPGDTMILQVPGEDGPTVHWIKLDRALEIFTQYIETSANT